VKITSPKKRPTDLEKRFQEMQQQLLVLRVRKNLRVNEGLMSAHEAAKKKQKIHQSNISATDDNDGDTTTHGKVTQLVKAIKVVGTLRKQRSEKGGRNLLSLF
jgi:hypothetical protein